MKKGHFISIFLILLIGLAYFFWFDFKNNLVLFSGDHMIPLNPTANLKFLTTWIDNNNGMVILSSYHYITLFYLLLSKLSLTLTQIQFFHVYLFHVIGSLGVYYLASVLLRAHPQKKLIALLSAISYLFSPAFLNMYFAYPSIAFVPLALALFIEGIHRKNRYFFALLIGIVVGIGNLPDPHPRPFFLIMGPMVLYSITYALLSKRIKENIFYLALVVIYVILCNAWFFLGMIGNSFFNHNIIAISKEVPITFGVDHKFADEGTAVIGKMFRLFHDGIPMAGDQIKFYLTSWFMLTLHYLRPILAFSTLLFLGTIRREIVKNILFLIILALVSLFLAKSVNPPIGFLYRFMLEYIPVFRLFRTSAYFILGAAVAYSILVPFSLFEIARYVKQYWFPSRVVYGVVIVILFILSIISSYPVLFRYPAYLQPDPAKPAELGMRIPPDYYRLAGYIDSQPEDTKVFTLPLDPGYELLKEDPWYFGIPMLPYVANKPIINQRVQDFGVSYSLPLVIEKELIEGNPNSFILLNLSNIRYIVVKNNATNIDQLAVNSQISKNYRHVKTFDNAVLYENASYLPHIYVPDRIVIIDSDPNQLPNLIVDNKIQLRDSIFFSPQNTSEKLEMVLNLKTKLNKPPMVEYKKINQTKYRVIIRNASAGFHLVFSETYSEGWKLYQSNLLKSQRSPNNKYVSINNKGTTQNDNLPEGSLFETLLKKDVSINSHLIVNSFANSWIIDPMELCRKSTNCIKNSAGSYDFELVIEYSPQKISHIGYLISFLTILITLGYFVSRENYVWKSQKRRNGDSAK